MRRPRLTMKGLMIGVAILAVCLSFLVRADRLREAASGRQRQLSTRGATRGARPEHWRAFQETQRDMEKADFLESFVLTLALVLVVLAALAARRRRQPSLTPPVDPSLTHP